MKPYETIKSSITYRGQIVDVKQDIIALPNGNSACREVVIRGPAAAILPVDDNGNVILVRQYRHPITKMSLEIPAGVLDEGESDPKSCAIRELEEETGLKAGSVNFLMKIHTTIGFCTEEIYIYLARGLTEGQTCYDDEEFIEIEKYTLHEAVSKIFSGEITDSKTIAALLAYISHTKSEDDE